MLDKLPHPDVIFASPPCESFSTAKSCRTGEQNNLMVGNWKKELREKNLFNAVNYHKKNFCILSKTESEKCNNKTSWTHYNTNFYTRINGELCAFNTTEIIKKYKPKNFIIENPFQSEIWNYYKYIVEFSGIKNVTHYNAYDKDYPHKPTIFFSDKKIFLRKTNELSDATIGYRSKKKHKNKNKKHILNYNEKSSIPDNLILDIASQIDLLPLDFADKNFGVEKSYARLA